MQNFTFRPWGRPNWLMSKSRVKNWVAIACLATETRSVSSALEVSRFANHIHMIKINDPSPSLDGLYLEAYQKNTAFFEEHCSTNYSISEFDLKSSLDQIRAITNEAGKKSANVIVDITSFPKRWFFPILRFLVNNPKINNLKVIYTRGANYAQVLSENPETLRVIPSFVTVDNRSDHEHAFVGVGFHTHSMVTMFGSDNARTLQMLFPFPPGPPNTHRNWRFAQQIERIVQREDNLIRDDNLMNGEDPIKYLYLDAKDVSQVFDAMKMTTDGGSRTSIMAPYGPKPFSLAMCLFALAVERKGMPEVPVFYSQPQRYAVKYTESEARFGEVIDSWCYSLKYQGKFIYEI